MKMQRIAILLTALNALILILVIAYLQPAKAQPQQGAIAPILRGRGLEIIDSLGKLKASITVYPPTQQDGKAVPGATVFRLINSKGQPVVKIAASEKGGGLSFGDGMDDYIQIVAGRDSSFIKISQQGKEKVIKQ